MQKIILSLIFQSIASIFPVQADSHPSLTFLEIWKRVRDQAPEIKAADHELSAARINENRASRHWYPRILAEGRVYSTNDPAQNFMSLLGQRQIIVSDFIPQALNQPGSNLFEHGTVGLDFPLFEGGAKVAMAEASTKMTEAKRFGKKSTEIMQYAELADTYSSILSLQKQQDELQALVQGVEETLAHYKIGTKSNPVGYSGLLGLKNLQNRLEGLLVENSSKSKTFREQVRILASDLPAEWTPKFENPRDFLTKYLVSETRHSSQEQLPALVQSMNLSAESLEKAKDAEKARFLPKVGLFGSGDLYGGNRAVGTSYTAGAYIQWNLFSASDFGASSQAEHTAAAAQAKADGLNQRARMERSGAVESSAALEKNLVLMEESSKLLEEQIAISRSLFRNGSMNALQWVEVLARRVDLTVSRVEAEINLAHSRKVLFVNSNIEEVPHEN